jgi:predicted GNAT family acetyltransferase
MTTTVRDNPADSRYEITVDDELAGFCAYVRSDDVVDITHTEVFTGREGQGVGSTLVSGALDDIRAQGLRVRPTCPFVRSYVERHTEYADLVAA